jgi:broad specificity phosphatase PhoE
LLLACVLEEPLLEAADRKINNGSITVVDIKNDRVKRLDEKSQLLGGQLSVAPADFDFEIPLSNAIRINEIRHLPVEVL